MSEPRTCIGELEGGCEGPVQERPALSGLGTVPRCDAHDVIAKERAERQRKRYWSDQQEGE